MSTVYKIKAEKRRQNGKIRRQRERDAKLKSNHSHNEWIEMLDFFEWSCVRCNGYSGSSFIEKDHIQPIYIGGSNGLNNIQPLCSYCNRSKSSENIDWRLQAANRLNKKLPSKYTKNG